MSFTRILKKIFFCFCAVLFAVSLIAFPLFSDGTMSAYAEDGAENDGLTATLEKVNEYLEVAVKRAHIPAASVTIVGKNSVLFSAAYGDLESTKTPFLLGSVSKSFTALCIMQLVERGKINLDEKISIYLPNISYGGKITVKQLLNHTSGLGEHQNIGNGKIIGEQGKHVYANVNYTLLGKIVEAVSGKSYSDYVKENIFSPLNMDRSSANSKESAEKGLTDGYCNWFGINVKTSPKYPSSDAAWISVPAGYIFASTDDLGKYLQMYLNGGNGIITSESIYRMFYDGVQVDADIPYKYGMGWTYIDSAILPEPVLRHSGLIETGMSCVYILPESEIGIAMAVNVNDYFVAKDFMDRIDWSIALTLMGKEPNDIGENEYSVSHLLYDLSYIAAFIISVLPLCLIRIYKKRAIKGVLAVKIVVLILLHFGLPALLLALPELFFATPLWVVKAFVPDMFLTLIVSSCLLLIGGGIKTAYLILYGNGEKKAS